MLLTSKLNWGSGSKRTSVWGYKCWSGSEVLSGSGPPQSSLSVPISICSGCLWWSCEDSGFSSSSSSSSSNVNLVTSSSSWLVQSSSCSSLMCGGSGTSWSRLELHSCCSDWTSSLLTDSCWTSAGNRNTQTHTEENWSVRFWEKRRHANFHT